MEENLKELISKEETIYYEGKSNMLGSFMKGFINIELVLLLMWICWRIIRIGLFGLAGEHGILEILLIVVPIIDYIYDGIDCMLRAKNRYYIVTDRGVYKASGIIKKHYVMKLFEDIEYVNLDRGLIDRYLDVGDIEITTNEGGRIYIQNIENYIDVYNMIKKMQEDINTDTTHPNELRPKENPGYNTKYTGLDK